MENRLRVSPELTVFITSFCLMAIELTAGRIMAPFLGVSVYTWTSVIGVILLGMTFGNYAGGLMADRSASSKALGMFIAGAGVAALLTNFVAPLIGTLLGLVALPLAAKTVAFAFVAFFPAGFLLSAVSPQVVKQRLHDLGRVGSVTGSVAAWSTAGSIAGTFLGGFVLISSFGTKWVMTLVAIALMGLGLFLASEAKLWKRSFSGLVAVFLAGDLLMPSLCRVETNYYCIRVTDTQDANGAAYTLRLDHLVHSFVHPQNPDILGYPYEQIYTNLLALRHGTADAFSTFFIGGGGYVLPRYIHSFFPNASVTVAEIDPGVTAANHAYMDLPDDTPIQTVNRDARMYLAGAPEGQKFEFVFGDAFNDFSVPYHLTTVEFHRLLKSRMTPDGVYALNIIDDVRYGHFLASMTRTLQAVWKYVYVAPENTDLLPGRNTIILMASDQPIDLAKWKQTDAPHNATTKLDPAAHALAISILPQEKIDAFLASHPDPMLTDDFAPTDRELSPVFRDAY